MKKIIAFFAVAVFLYSGLALADNDKQKSSKHAATRFMLNKGEVYDNKTKLTWRRCSVGTSWKEGTGCTGSPQLMDLKEALRLAQKLGNGWRIPTIDELYSIVEQGKKNPAINSIVFPDIKNLGEEGAPYWSLTRVEKMPMLVYYVDFIRGQIDGHSEGFVMAVRLVRSK